MTNFTGKVIEVKDTQTYAYILESPTMFFTVAYKVLLGQEKNGFIKCTKVSHNGKDKLVYDVTKYKTLESLLYTLNLETTLDILIQLLDAVVLVKNNGFMQCENILISPDHIFVDCDDYNVNLIYLPIYHESDNGSYRIFELELKANLLLILNTYNEKNPYIAAICENMNTPDFIIEDVLSVFKDLQLNNYEGINKRGKRKDSKLTKAVESNDMILNMKKLFSFKKSK